MYVVMYIGREMIRYSHLLESHFENASFYTRMLINVSSRANVLVLENGEIENGHRAVAYSDDISVRYFETYRRESRKDAN